MFRRHQAGHLRPLSQIFQKIISLLKPDDEHISTLTVPSNFLTLLAAQLCQHGFGLIVCRKLPIKHTLWAPRCDRECNLSTVLHVLPPTTTVAIPTYHGPNAPKIQEIQACQNRVYNRTIAAAANIVAA